MTEEELIVEFEACLAYKGEKLKDCSCGMQTHSGICPACHQTVSGDPIFDAAQRAIEAGEDFDLENLRRPIKDTFVPLKPGELP